MEELAFGISLIETNALSPLVGAGFFWFTTVIALLIAHEVRGSRMGHAWSSIAVATLLLGFSSIVPARLLQVLAALFLVLGAGLMRYALGRARASS